MSEVDTRFEEYTIVEFHSALKRGAVSSAELTKWYLNRIQTLDIDGPALSSIVTINPDALDRARELDEHFALTGTFVGPLHGVPILIKDQAETAGLRTTFGSALFKDYLPEQDSAVVEKIRAAGAIILAKTSMNDLACGYSSHSTMTGLTKNPYDLTRDTGGSSSGTGASVAANLGLVGIGEDTGGSIRVPSSFNNLYGLRVTAGLISRRGLQGLVPTQDTPGPMARTVGDLVALLDTLIGYDPADDLTAIAAETPWLGGFTELLATLPQWSDFKVGVLESAFDNGDDPERVPVNDAVRQAVEKLESFGVDIVHGLEIVNLEGWFDRTSLYETVSRSVLAEFFASHGAPVSSYEEFLASKSHNPLLSTFDWIAGGSDSPTDDIAYLKALHAQYEFRQIVLNLMAANDLDVLVFPTVKALPPRHADMESGVDVGGFPTNTIVGSQAVLPAMSVPTGLTANGLPVGLEVLTRPLREDILIQFAALWERDNAPRVRPCFG